MGQSAGRSSGNREGRGARRRNTPRERALIDPPWDKDHVVPRYLVEDQAPTEPKWFVWLSYASMVGFVVLLVFVLGLWFRAW